MRKLFLADVPFEDIVSDLLETSPVNFGVKICPLRPGRRVFFFKMASGGGVD
jgi:hypothetical protein